MMEIKGQEIILDAGEVVTIRYREKEEVVPTPTPPSDETVGRLDLLDLIGRFNNVLTDRGYNAINVSMEVYDILRWQYGFAEDRYDKYWAFMPSTYPLLYDYRGEDKSDAATAYNAMQSWMMAMSLAELVPDSGETTNTQTEIFKLAYEIGGGRNYPLYGWKALIADPYAMREVGSVMQSICRGDINYRSKIDLFRDELGGHPIEASCWEELGYKNEKLFDSEGRCIGQIPVTFLQLFYPEYSFSGILRANVYKCGDLTSHKHYLSWNAIESEKPDFHRPEDFGMMVFDD